MERVKLSQKYVPDGALMVLRAAALFDGVRPALTAKPSVVIADGVIAAVHGPAEPLPADAHSARSIADAVAAGVDGIEHATFMTADGVDAPEALIRDIARQRIAVGWTVGRDPGRPHTVPPQIASRMAAMITNRRWLHESGAVLVPGSDAGVTPAKPHDVLRFAPDDLAAAGLSAAEILHAMTSLAAQACGLGQRKGRIAPGFDADILAIDGNPLDDLAAIRELRAVYIGGRPVRPAPGGPDGSGEER